MPNIPEIQIGALQGSDAQQQISSVVSQLNDWSRLIANESIASIQRDASGNVRIVQGLIKIGTTELIGTLYYDTSDIPRIFVGLAPNDNRPGIWISKDGINVVTELGG